MVSTVKMSKDAEANSLDTCPPVYNLIGRVGMKINNCNTDWSGKNGIFVESTHNTKARRTDTGTLEANGMFEKLACDRVLILNVNLQVNTVIPGKEKCTMIQRKKCVNKAIILSIE